MSLMYTCFWSPWAISRFGVETLVNLRNEWISSVSKMYANFVCSADVILKLHIQHFGYGCIQQVQLPSRALAIATERTNHDHNDSIRTLGTLDIGPIRTARKRSKTYPFWPCVHTAPLSIRSFSKTLTKKHRFENGAVWKRSFFSENTKYGGIWKKRINSFNFSTSHVWKRFTFLCWKAVDDNGIQTRGWHLLDSYKQKALFQNGD